MADTNISISENQINTENTVQDNSTPDPSKNLSIADRFSIFQFPSTDGIRTLRWVALCSDKGNNIDKCRQITNLFFKRLNNEDGKNEEANRSVSVILNTIFLNRNSDVEFLKMLWEYKIQIIDLTIIYSLYNMYSAISNPDDMKQWLDEYIERHGEDKDVIMLELSFYTLPDNYQKYVDKVNELLTKSAEFSNTPEIDNMSNTN